jgi:tripartite-type tricarboxylate transporter receptor subunit TctC
MEAHVSPKRFSHFAALLLAGIALGCSVWPLGAAAQQPYPNHLIKIIYSEVAGGPTDIVTRAIADKMSVSLKQPIIIENRPGAGGNVGAEAIARATPDGYTLGMVLGTTLTVNPSVYKKLPFDPDKDFRPLSIVATSAYASGGIGTPGHLVMENFRVRAGFEAVHVPYRGNAPMVIDLVAGQVKFGFVTSAGMMDHVQAGRLKALGVARASRSPLAPEVPTIAESGYPGFRVENYSVMLAPAGIPEPIAALLEREVQAALKHPDITERLRAMDTTPVGMIGAEVLARLKADREAWAEVVATANMRLD